MQSTKGKPGAKGPSSPREPPRVTGDPCYDLLRRGEWAEFNARKQRGDAIDLVNADLRAVDFRLIDVDGLNLSNAYLRQADLRGVDLRTCNLEGASINGARISGTFFPEALTPEEILLSLQHGTRLRYRR